jgi:hypothetical protein
MTINTVDVHTGSNFPPNLDYKLVEGRKIVYKYNGLKTGDFAVTYSGIYPIYCFGGILSFGVMIERKNGWSFEGRHVYHVLFSSVKHFIRSMQNICSGCIHSCKDDNPDLIECPFYEENEYR